MIKYRQVQKIIYIFKYIFNDVEIINIIDI